MEDPAKKVWTKFVNEIGHKRQTFEFPSRQDSPCSSFGQKTFGRKTFDQQLTALAVPSYLLIGR